MPFHITLYRSESSNLGFYMPINSQGHIGTGPQHLSLVGVEGLDRFEHDRYFKEIDGSHPHCEAIRHWQPVILRLGTRHTNWPRCHITNPATGHW